MSRGAPSSSSHQSLLPNLSLSSASIAETGRLSLWSGGWKDPGRHWAGAWFLGHNTGPCCCSLATLPPQQGLSRDFRKVGGLGRPGQGVSWKLCSTSRRGSGWPATPALSAPSPTGESCLFCPPFLYTTCQTQPSVLPSQQSGVDGGWALQGTFSVCTQALNEFLVNGSCDHKAQQLPGPRGSCRGH